MVPAFYSIGRRYNSYYGRDACVPRVKGPDSIEHDDDDGRNVPSLSSFFFFALRLCLDGMGSHWRDYIGTRSSSLSSSAAAFYRYLPT